MLIWLCTGASELKGETGEISVVYALCDNQLACQRHVGKGQGAGLSLRNRAGLRGQNLISADAGFRHGAFDPCRDAGDGDRSIGAGGPGDGGAYAVNVDGKLPAGEGQGTVRASLDDLQRAGARCRCRRRSRRRGGGRRSRFVPGQLQIGFHIVCSARSDDRLVGCVFPHQRIAGGHVLLSAGAGDRLALDAGGAGGRDGDLQGVSGSREGDAVVCKGEILQHRIAVRDGSLILVCAAVVGQFYAGRAGAAGAGKAGRFPVGNGDVAQNRVIADLEVRAQGGVHRREQPIAGGVLDAVVIAQLGNHLPDQNLDGGILDLPGIPSIHRRIAEGENLLDVAPLGGVQLPHPVGRAACGIRGIAGIGGPADGGCVGLDAVGVHAVHGVVGDRGSVEIMAVDVTSFAVIPVAVPVGRCVPGEVHAGGFPNGAGGGSCCSKAWRC